MSMTLSEKEEMLILSNLRADGRVSLTRLSRKTSIPVSTIYDKLKAFENEVIRKHTCIIDFLKLGYGTRATLLLKVKKENKLLLKDYLMKHKAVNSCYKINNGYDFIVEVVFKELRDVEGFLENLENEFGIEDAKVHYIIDELRREDFLSNPEYVKITSSLVQ